VQLRLQTIPLKTSLLACLQGQTNANYCTKGIFISTEVEFASVRRIGRLKRGAEFKACVCASRKPRNVSADGNYTSFIILSPNAHFSHIFLTTLGRSAWQRWVPRGGKGKDQPAQHQKAANICRASWVGHPHDERFEILDIHTGLPVAGDTTDNGTRSAAAHQQDEGLRDVVTEAAPVQTGNAEVVRQKQEEDFKILDLP